MIPVGNSASSSTLTSPLSTRNQPAAVPRSQPTLLFQEETAPPNPRMDWKEQEDFHQARKEPDLAIELYTKALQKAEKHKNPDEIIDNLKNLGQAYLAKGRLVVAAKIFNGAFALCQKHHDEKAMQTTLSCMAEVERTFLEKECKVREIPQPQGYLEQRQQLQALRQTVRTKIEQNCPSQQILKEFSQGISTFLEGMLQQMYPTLGKPPCEFTFLGLGSLGRKEMSPYSDLEFALLVRDSSAEYLSYFRKMVKLLEIRVIHLGETALKILDHGYESPTPRGFSFDDGGNTPLGKEGYVELIKTPQDLAQFQNERFYEEDLILSNVLKTAGVLVGSEALHQEYTQAMQSILSKPSAKKALTIRQERALNIISGHLLEFEPQLDPMKEKTPVFNIKVELYRLPSFLIAGLADYFGIEEQNTWDKLDALAKRKILSEGGVNNLKIALDQLMHLRIRCHLHYRRECDDVFYPNLLQWVRFSKEQLKQAFILNESDIEKIKNFFRVILPLHRIFKDVLQEGDLNNLSNETFYDDSLLVKAQLYRRLHLYQQSKECYQQALALEPDNEEVQLDFAWLLFELEEYSQASNYAMVVSANQLMRGGKKNYDKFFSFYLLLSRVSTIQGELEKAFDSLRDGLKIMIERFGQQHLYVAGFFRGLGEAWCAVGNFEKVIKCYEEALKIERTLAHGKQYSNEVECLNQIGMAWLSLMEPRKAKRFLEEGLLISKKFDGEESPETASALKNLGTVCKHLGDEKKRIKYYEKALKVFRKVFGDEHNQVAECLNLLGKTCLDLGKEKKAIEHLSEALSISKRYCSGEHPSMSLCTMYLASVCYLSSAWIKSGDGEKAIGYLEEKDFLRIEKKIFANESYDVSTSLYILGLTWIDLKKPEKAVEYLEKALEMLQKSFDNQHPHVVELHTVLSSVWKELGNEKKASWHYEQTLEEPLMEIERYGQMLASGETTVNNVLLMIRQEGKRSLDQIAERRTLNEETTNLLNPKQSSLNCCAVQ